MAFDKTWIVLIAGCGVLSLAFWNGMNAITLKDDSFVDVYQLWVSDVDYASVWFAYKYCAAQTFQIS